MNIPNNNHVKMVASMNKVCLAEFNQIQTAEKNSAIEISRY